VNDDRQQVKAVLAGDESAFGTLVDRYQERTYRLACRYLGDTTAAEDVCMETFERVHSKLAQFDGRAGFSTWLYRILVNACKNHLRRVRREQRRTMPLQTVSEISTDAESSPRGHVLEREMESEILSAVDSLSTKVRSAWLLFATEGLKISEIAEVEGCSVSAVKNRLFQARKRLQSQLRKYMSEY